MRRQFTPQRQRRFGDPEYDADLDDEKDLENYESACEDREESRKLDS